MPTESMRYHVAGDAAWLTLARPERRNAFDATLLSAFQTHLAQAINDEQVRSIVIAAEGPSFCSGADLRGDGSRPAGELAAEAVVLLADTLTALSLCPKPLIARVQGPVVGGGLGFVAASDVAVASHAASFTLREVRVGAVPAVVAVPLLDRLSVSTIRDLTLTGATVEAERARQIGLVDRVADDLDTEVAAVLAELGTGAPGAQASSKQLLRVLPTLTQTQRWQHAVTLSQKHFTGDEAAEGLAAFADKRDPNWKR